MPKVRITSPEVVGEIYLHGAHVTSWKPAGRRGSALSQLTIAMGTRPRNSWRRTNLFPLVWRQGGRSESAGTRVRPHDGVEP